MELREHAPPSRPINPGMPYREDCWSEGETSALVDAWGERYLELNRGNLRQKQWQEVADAVNCRIGTTRRKMRTDVQCKNRIDTLKKKYKLEKARLVEGTAVTSSWPFYGRLDALIGATTPAAGSGSSGGGGGMKRPSPSSSYSHSFSHSPSPALAIPLPYQKRGSGMLPTASPLHGKLPAMTAMTALPTALPIDDSFIRKAAAAAAAAASSLPMANAFIRKTPPVAPPVFSGENSFIRKAPAPPALPMDNSFIRKAAAAAAAAKGEAAEEEEEESEGEGNSEPRSVSMGERKKGKKRGSGEGILQLAKAIEKMGEMYERVEGTRQRQMMEMEKQRMEFLKGLELQRMEMFADLKVQMEKVKRARRSSDAGELIGSVAAISFLSNSSFL